MQEHSQKEILLAAKIEEVATLLKSHGIPLEYWGVGKAKTVRHLVTEIIDRETELIAENGELKRKISVVHIDVEYNLNGQKLTLVEDRQEFKDGRIRKRGLDGVSEKMKPGENPFISSKRALLEELGLVVEAGFEHIVTSKKTLASSSYPGLITDYLVHQMRINMPLSLFHSEGYREVQIDKTTYFVWRKT